MSRVYLYALADPRTGEPRYIGKTINVDARLRHHLWQSEFRTDGKSKWLRELSGAGLSPEVRVFDEYASGVEWQYAERYWIDHIRSHGARLFNKAKGGIGGLHGYKHTPETRARMSAAQKGRTFSESTRQKMRLAKLGKKQSPEHIEKVRAALVGRKVSDETRRKISLAHIGKKHTPEARLKMSLSHTGKKMPQDQVARMAAAHRGMKYKHRSDCKNPKCDRHPERAFVQDVEVAR